MKGKAKGIFDPEGKFTRAEAATVLSRLSEGFSEAEAYSGAMFKDVSSSAWYYKYISFAQQNNLVYGYDDNTFRPDQPIKRQEFAVMICRFLGISRIEAGNEFTDIDDAGDWSKGYIAALKKNGIVIGYEDGSFRPLNDITRAEATTMLNRVLNRIPDKKLDLASHGYSNSVTDVAESAWYFAHVMEATIDHEISDFHKQ